MRILKYASFLTNLIMFNESKFTIFNLCLQYSLNEEQHIVRQFEECSKYIVNNIQNFDQDKLVYSGFNWHISSSKCTYDNNENSGFPIYINICNFDNLDNKFAYTQYRDLSDNKIVIYINKNFISDPKLYGKLQHEFVHVRTQYAKYFKNPLEGKKHNYDVKNIFYYENRIKRLLFNYSQLQIVTNILYVMSKTEQDARINQVYRDLDFINVDLTNFSLIKIIKEIEDESLLQYFDDLKDQINQYNDFKLLLIIAYYLNKFGYGINSNYLSDDNMKRIFSLNYKISETDFNICNKVINLIDESFQEYQNKICKIINKYIKEQNKN